MNDDSYALEQFDGTARLFPLPNLVLFPHVVQWNGGLYLEDGLHRALRAALQQRTSIHARVLAWPTA